MVTKDSAGKGGGEREERGEEEAETEAKNSCTVLSWSANFYFTTSLLGQSTLVCLSRLSTALTVRHFPNRTKGVL